MLPTDGTIEQKLFSDLEWIYYCLLSKTVMQIKHLPSTKFYRFQHKSNIIVDIQAYSIIQNMNNVLILSQV